MALNITEKKLLPIRRDGQIGTTAIISTSGGGSGGGSTGGSSGTTYTAGNGISIAGTVISADFGTTSTKTACGSHNHAGIYLPIGGTAVDSDCLGGQEPSYYATASHTHAAYLPIAGCACDSKCFGAQEPSYYATATHLHGNITNGGCIGGISGCVLVTTTNGCITVASSMPPASHTHGSITNDGKIGTASGCIVVTSTNGCVAAVAPITVSVGCAVDSTCLGGQTAAYYAPIAAPIFTTSASAPLISGGTCVRAPYVYASTCAYAPIFCGTSCVKAPVTCGTTCVRGGVIFGNTCVTGAVSCGTTCIVTPTLKATTGIISPVIQLTTGAGAGRVLTSDADGNASWCIPFVGTTCLCGLTGDVSIINPQLNQVLVYDNYKWININNVNLDCIAAGTCVISPIISGITCVRTPILCATTCSRSAVHCSTTAARAPYFCASTGIISPVIQLTTGAGNGCVLTSDASGNASWATPSGGGGTTCLCGLTGDVSIINPQLNNILVYDSHKWININNVNLDCIAAGTCVISPIISGTSCVETPRYKSAAALAMCAAAGCNAVVMNGSEFFICALANSSVSLYYDNAEKLKTLSTGICACGNIEASGCFAGACFVGSGAGHCHCNLYNSTSIKACTTTGGLCACGCVWATDFVASSDCRCKKEIMPIYNAISVVDRLQGVYYKLCNDTSEKCRMGMIAQNVAKVVPEVVYTAEDGMLGIDYAKLVPVLIEAIHQLQKQITNIKTYGY